MPSRLRPLADELERRRNAYEDEMLHYGEYLDQCTQEEEEEEEDNDNDEGSGRPVKQRGKRVRFHSRLTSY